MSLESGARLGPYEILSPIGAGGMGEVYRACDKRLKRDVALKILPESFASDSERLARFQREAEVLASLNHPNIAQIYGIEESNGTRALVMELVEGEDLSQRIARGPIPIDEALPIARQICEALEAAHEQGIIHRDLKPANIKLRPDGTVKVLDFGLAKLNESPSPVANPSSMSMSPTITSPAMMTGVGVLLGTIAYMSPEQAKGKPADKRSDIWAFGCVLFEMLTGRRAFAGDEVSDVSASILARQPDWTLFPRELSPVLATYIRRCLHKDRKDRIADVQTVRLALQGAFESAPTQTQAPDARRTRKRLVWMTVVVLLTIALALSFVFARPSIPNASEMRVEITTPLTDSPLHFAISPDGNRLVFVASGDGASRLWVRALDATAAQPLAGTENAEYPFWSPDNRSIGFFAGGKLKRVDIGGGPPQALADASAGRGGSWNRDGMILFAESNAGPLLRVSASGGEPSVLTRMGAGHTSHRFPQFLPDGRHFLFFVQGSPEAQGIYFGSLDRGEPRRVEATDTAGLWAPPGRLFSVKQGTLVAQAFDAERGTFTGDRITVADPVAFDGAFNLGGFSVSPAGPIAYRAGGSQRRLLTWFGRDGKPMGTAGELDEGAPQFPELSADGRRLADSRFVQSNSDVWLTDLTRGGRTRFTFDAALDSISLWSPDGKWIAFRSNRKGAYDLYLKASTGAGDEELILQSTHNKAPLSWSADGRYLLYWDLDPKTNYDLWILPMTGERKPSRWLSTPFAESNGQFSPDGRWVAYQSNESGSFEIYVQPFPAASAKWQISTNGGTMPRWGSDGKELFFIGSDARLMAAAVTTSGAMLEAAPPVALFQTRIVGGPGQVNKHQYAVGSDGRFLIVEPAEASGTTPIMLILNWKAAS
jgi:eukaryotic-like serine/threonine-protein kinase